MDNINFSDFEKVDIRIGLVLEADVPAWSHWVLKMKVDFGDEIGIKQCFSGIMKFYKTEDLVGKKFPFVVNLEPKSIGPEKELSEAMMIMAVPREDEETAPVLFKISSKVPNGAKVR